MTLLADLIPSKTAAQLRDAVLARLTALGFPVTSWGDGGVARTLVEGFAWVVADARVALMLVAKGGLLDEAEGAWLSLLSKSVFDLERILATFAVGEVTLTEGAGSGPHTITAGQMIVGRNGSGSTPARRFVAVTGGTLNPSGTLNIRVKAEEPGTGFNLAHGDVAFLFTPLPGVTVSAASNWLTATNCTPAVDEETDARLRQRCRDRWATLGSGFTRAAVRYWCTSALFSDGSSVGCTRVGFATPPGDGSYVVYVAGATGGLGSTGVTRLQAVLEERCPITDDPAVTDATEVPLVVSGAVQFKAGFNTSANQIALRDAVAAYVNAKDIGDASGVDLGGIYAAMYGAVPGGVQDIDLTQPTGDTAVTAGTIALADTTGLTFS